MANNFIDSPIVQGMADLTYTMWKRGWDESNGGNVSIILSPEELKDVSMDSSVGVDIVIPNVPSDMVGRYLLITASGSQFRTLKNHLTRDIGLIRITENGYRIMWGFEENRKATSEFYMHVLSHSARLKVDPNHRVVVHNHATNATAYSLISEPNDKEYTLPLWQVLTESIVVFPDGVGVLPWQLPGTEEIGMATAEKLLHSRIVVWTFHGILATGTSYQDCFGLIETVDKAAKIYMDTLNIRQHIGLTKNDIMAICDKLEIQPREGILN